jgi:hypothetical protein
MMEDPKRKPRRTASCDQFALDLSGDPILERMVEARVAIRAENEAVHWRLRLVMIEAVMLSVLVLVAGLLLHHPAALVVRNALVIGTGALLGGGLLVGLSALAGHGLSRLRSRGRP